MVRSRMEKLRSTLWWKRKRFLDAGRAKLGLPEQVNLISCSPGVCNLPDRLREHCYGICGLKLSNLHIVLSVDPDEETGTLHRWVGKCGFCGAETTFTAQQIWAEEFRHNASEAAKWIAPLIFPGQRTDIVSGGVFICSSCGRIAKIF